MAGSFKGLRALITGLCTTMDRKTDKEMELVRPILEAFPYKIKGQVLNETEWKTLAKHCVYVKKEPGEVVAEHGKGSTQACGMYIVLKGMLQM